MRNAAHSEANRLGLLRLVANAVPSPLRPLARLLWSSFNLLKVQIRRTLGPGTYHGLSGELVVSLTSYPARFRTLHLTLRCLLTQSVKPDRIVLWIADDDIGFLPTSVRQLTSYGLEIRACEDLRSYKKLVPALEAFPDAYIVTADDDLYYPRNWLEILVDGVEPGSKVIHGRRTVRLVRDQVGRLAPFHDWQWDVSDERARKPSSDIMCETGAGGLFPPKSLHQIATDRSQFQRLSPDGDDLWFYWCSRMAGTLTKKVGDSLIIVPWPSAQVSSLWTSNEQGGNDRKIAALVNEFGYVD